MNLNFFYEFAQQMVNVWNSIKLYQKFTVVIVGLLLLTIFGFLLFNATSTQYSQIFPIERLSLTDAAEIKNFLDTSGMTYKIKGDRSIFVPTKMLHRIRMDLASIGMPKSNSNSGFELFDNNTWIKGEKELQILEMRALRGQLERDIASYDNVKSAKIMLDIAPARTFSGSTYKTKASVILDLVSGARINQSQLRAISYHISGAVRGLFPNMIAISDTMGKLYQSIDPENDTDLLRGEEIALEERIHSKVTGLLAMIVGHDNFYCTVQAVIKRERINQERKIFSGIVDGVDLGESVPLNITESGSQINENERGEEGIPGTTSEALAGVSNYQGSVLNRSESNTKQQQQMAVPVSHLRIFSKPGKIENISIAVMIDKTITVGSSADLPKNDVNNGMRNAESLRQEIFNQIKKILEGYGVKNDPAIDFVEFDKTKQNEQSAEETFDQFMGLGIKISTGLLVVLVILGMFFTFHKFWKKNMDQPPEFDNNDETEINKLLSKEEPSLVEVEAMMEAIKTKVQKDPTIVIDTIREWLIQDKNEKVKEE